MSDTPDAPAVGRRGSLTVVGLGFRVDGHPSIEARREIRAADRLLYLVQDDWTPFWLRELNPAAESLGDSYGVGRDRLDSYAEMVERMLAPVRRGERLCVAVYGHPGVFARPTHEAVRRARREGHEARMLPAISAEDCLFADLGVDPSTHGCQSYEATDFLVRRPRFDPTSALVLWQIGNIASPAYRTGDRVWNPRGLRVLVDVLLEDYPPGHPVIAYLAPSAPGVEPRADRLALAELAEADVPPASTVYLPPVGHRPADLEMLERLGLADYPDRGDR